MTKLAATLTAPTGLTKILPEKCDAEGCEGRLQIGVFFDGTRNDKSKASKVSNIARLSDVYPNTHQDGFFRLYLQGVGTPFREVAEKSASTSGATFGSGGWSRILFAQILLMNAIRGYLGVERIDESDFTEWCGGHKMGDYPLAFKTWQSKTKELVQSTDKPKIKEIVLDVFGFSRGAAQARAFVNQLVKVEGGATLYGIPIKFRFLGLFDTVASVGIQVGGAAVGASGHMTWADGASLQIPAQVKNCVHFVAMHENRGSFPVDLLFGQTGGKWIQLMYPGMHSDVGGGYDTDEQGVGRTDDAKLSQIPLNHMYAAAKSAGVPLAGIRGNSSFLTDAQLKSSYQKFITAINPAAKSIPTWLSTYLKWRWDNVRQFDQLSHVRRSNGDDRSKLLSANRGLKADIASPGTGEPALRKVLSNRFCEVYDEVAAFFTNYMHDSKAGFGLEPSGYLYRRQYFTNGSNKAERGILDDYIPGTKVVSRIAQPKSTEIPKYHPNDVNDSAVTDYSRNRSVANPHVEANDPTYGQTIDHSVPQSGDPRFVGGGGGS
jgi:hypothetical protein